jgi:hypothetical protein
MLQQTRSPHMRYFLVFKDCEKEVPAEEFCRVERVAKSQPGTGFRKTALGFLSHDISGRVEPDYPA